MTNHNTISRQRAESYRYAFIDAFHQHEELAEDEQQTDIELSQRFAEEEPDYPE